MVTVGKIVDRIGFDNGDLVYLGNKSGITQTELDSDNGCGKKDGNGVFFDTNNINKFVKINDNDNKVKETDESFINNAKFYTCSENGQTYLCFRCVNSCTFCVKCVKCDSSCYGCFQCTSCIDCVSGCNVCVRCNGCTACINCNSCHDGCRICVSNCHSCTSCESCASPRCVSCVNNCVKYY